jgi:hypothetical protein
MAWNCKLNAISKENATSAINALSATDCHGDTAHDGEFDEHLAAAKAGAIAAIAGLTGGAANFDVAIVCRHDSGPQRPHDTGAGIVISVVERH